MRKIFCVAAIMIGSTIQAQDTTKTMEQVTLTASKYSTKTTQTGKVVTIITRQDIEYAGSRDLAQVITEMGGVFINGFNSNAGKEKNIYLRGAKVDYTLITIDGVPVYDASGIGSNFDIRNISVDHVERIEILKGSQSTLYGSDAIAGVINIITKKGGTKPLAISGVTHYGSFGTWKANTAINGSRGIMDYNAGYSYTRTDGFSEAKRPETVSADFDNDAYYQHSFLVNLGFQAGKMIRVQPFLRYTKFSGDLDLDAFTDEKDFTNTNKNFQTGLRNIISLGNTQLNVLYQYINTDRFYLDDSAFHNSNAYFRYNLQSYMAKEHFGEAFVVLPADRVKITAGLDVRASNTDYYAVQKNIFSSADRPSYHGIRQNQFGIYAAANYAYQSFSVEGGARLNRHSEYGSNYAANINPSVFIKKRLKVFANASTGYKTPSLYQLFSVYGNPELEPETSVNLEGGLQFYTSDQKSSVRAVYFNRRISDAIAFFFDPVTFDLRYINQDEQNDHGFEVELNTTFADKIQLKAIYSYVNGEITTKQNGKDTTFFNLLRRPKSTINFFVGAQVMKRLYLNLQANAVGERKDVYFNPVTFAAEDITLKNYLLVNFYAEYALSKNRLKLFADLRIIFNEDYSDIYGYNTPGINAYGGIRFSF